MTATNHAVTGIAIAIAIHNPLALPLAFAAHFVEDAIPHSYLELHEIRIDILTSLALTVGLSMYLKNDTSVLLVLACAFLCASPDMVWGWRYFKFKDMKKLISAEPISWFSRWHQKIQWSESKPGLAIELVWLVALLTFIIKVR